MQGINIIGTGHYTPQTVITNNDLAEVVETSDEWITKRTGIKQRCISNGEQTWYMGTQAALKAIDAAGIDVSDIGIIIMSSTTEDYYFPIGAAMIQREIGAEGCMAIDINCACSGFVYGLDMARRYLAAGDIKYALMVSSESLSKITDFSDRSTCVLFADGAAACVVEASDKLYSSYHGADGKSAKFLCAAHEYTPVPIIKEPKPDMEDGLNHVSGRYIYQDGKEVYKFATKILPFAANKALEKAGLSPHDIDWYIPHQANYRIIETAAANLGVSLDKFIINLDMHGNTSSASIPTALDEAVRSGKVKKGDKICMVGFGAGLTYGCVITEY